MACGMVPEERRCRQTQRTQLQGVCRSGGIPGLVEWDGDLGDGVLPGRGHVGKGSQNRRERRLREVIALDATLRAFTSTVDMADILHDFLEHARQVTSAEGLSLLLYDHERDELVFAATETLQEHALVCRETPPPPAVGSLMSPERLIVSTRGEERVLGTIDLRRRYDGRPFDEADRRRAAAVAAELASRTDLERMAHEPDALQGVFARLAAAVPSQDATLVVYDQERRELAFRVSHALH